MEYFPHQINVKMAAYGEIYPNPVESPGGGSYALYKALGTTLIYLKNRSRADLYGGKTLLCN
jgi:hypothetical protein